MKKVIEINCKQCNKVFIVAKKHHKRKFCSRDCVNKFQTGEGNPAFGKVYRTKETHPEWASRTSKTHKERGHIVGDKNPMKNPEVAIKMGKTRSKRFQTDENFRKNTSELTRNAWKEGKYDGIKVGKCKWYDFVKKDGTICKVQGTWELAYIKWLENNNIPFMSHKGRIPYLDNQGNKRSYYPDFYLPNTKEYVDVKSDYHFNINKEKWELIRLSNPDINITILFKKDLQNLGIL